GPRLRARYRHAGAVAARRACPGRHAEPAGRHGARAAARRRHLAWAGRARRRLGLRRHRRHRADGAAPHRAGARVLRRQGAWRARSSAYDSSSPASALAITVGGLASHTLPGPERPGKLRLMALTVICSGAVEEPGPQLAQAPHDGWRMRAPMAAKVR